MGVQSEPVTIPVLVTKADVLDHLAMICVKLAGRIDLATFLLDVPFPRGGYGEQLVAAWKAKLPAPDLQIAAARDVAKLLSQLATEERILAARAADDRSKREPSRG